MHHPVGFLAVGDRPSGLARLRRERVQRRECPVAAVEDLHPANVHDVHPGVADLVDRPQRVDRTLRLPLSPIKVAGFEDGVVALLDREAKR